MTNSLAEFKTAALTYQPVFDAFKKIKGDDAVVAGDAGTSTLFAFPPYDCVDLTTFYGGSIPLACGLYGAFAFGSRGLLWAALAAEVLPAIACGEPIPIERELLEAIAPARLLRRRLRRGLLR